MRRQQEKLSTINLEQIQPEALQCILEFLYLGQTSVPLDKMPALMVAAKSLQLIDFDVSNSAQLGQK